MSETMPVREKFLRTIADVLKDLKPGDDEDAVFQRDAAEAHIRELSALAEKPSLPHNPADADTQKLIDDIASAINRNSAENGSNTPDFLLAEFLVRCLRAFDKTSWAREKWYGTHLSIGAAEKPAERPADDVYVYQRVINAAIEYIATDPEFDAGNWSNAYDKLHNAVKEFTGEQTAAERPTEFCLYCGAGIGKFRRNGEGTCPKCDPKEKAE